MEYQLEKEMLKDFRHVFQDVYLSTKMNQLKSYAKRERERVSKMKFKFLREE